VKYLHIGCLLLMIVFGSAYADEPDMLDLKVAGKSLKQAESVLKQKRTTFTQLRNLSVDIKALRRSAIHCSEKQEKDLEDISKLRQSLGIAKEGGGRTGSDISYINKREKRIKDRLAGCRLFQLRADAVLTELDIKIANLAKIRLWSKDVALWEFPAELMQSKNALFVAGNFISLQSLSVLSLTGIIYILLGTLALSYGVIWLNKSYIRSIKFPLWLVGLCSLSVCLYLKLMQDMPEPTLVNLAGVIVIFSVGYAFIRWLFSLKVSKDFLNWLSFEPKYAAKFCVIILSTWFAYSLLSKLVMWQELPKAYFHLLELIFIMLTYGLFYVVVNELFKHISKNKWLKKYVPLVKGLVLLLIAGGLLSEVLGYMRLSRFMAVNTVISTAYLIVFGVLYWIVYRLNVLFYDSKHPGSKKIRSLLGVTKRKRIIEFAIFTNLIKILLVADIVYLIVLQWDLSYATNEKLYSLMIEGFFLFGVHIVPANLINGILAYCVVSLLGRVLAQKFLNESERTKAEIAEYRGISQLIVYTGAVTGILTGLLISGISLTGLAIVAGALSVGIGLGLKSIINNFIAGIIVLIEKPIKVGDFITVGDITGEVKRISVRSTQVTTRRRVDVIIPNEDLITNLVSNYMLERPLYRVDCPIGVAYGSDVELVREVLLQIAEKNKDVISDDPKKKPKAILTGFGDSSIDFQLRVVIDDVPNRNNIRSDLYFAIEKAFRKHKIRSKSSGWFHTCIQRAASGSSKKRPSREKSEGRRKFYRPFVHSPRAKTNRFYSSKIGLFGSIFS